MADIRIYAQVEWCQFSSLAALLELQQLFQATNDYCSREGDGEWATREGEIDFQIDREGTGCTVVLIDPVVSASSSIKLSKPVKMVLRLHMGFHDSGWKSLMDRHRRRSVSNRPDGVTIIMAGGWYG
jgi:hypothetical protein